MPDARRGSRTGRAWTDSFRSEINFTRNPPGDFPLCRQHDNSGDEHACSSGSAACRYPHRVGWWLSDLPRRSLTRLPSKGSRVKARVQLIRKAPRAFAWTRPTFRPCLVAIETEISFAHGT